MPRTPRTLPARAGSAPGKKAVLAILGFAGMAGVAPDALLRGAGLDPSLFARSVPQLTHAEELRLWSAAARLTGDPDFGLHMAEWLAPRAGEIFDVLFFALRSCATLGDHYAARVTTGDWCTKQSS